MFTGIVYGLGEISAVTDFPHFRQLRALTRDTRSCTWQRSCQVGSIPKTIN